MTTIDEINNLKDEVTKLKGDVAVTDDNEKNK